MSSYRISHGPRGLTEPAKYGEKGKRTERINLFWPGTRKLLEEPRTCLATAASGFGAWWFLISVACLQAFRSREMRRPSASTSLNHDTPGKNIPGRCGGSDISAFDYLLTSKGLSLQSSVLGYDHSTGCNLSSDFRGGLARKLNSLLTGRERVAPYSVVEPKGDQTGVPGGYSRLLVSNRTARIIMVLEHLWRIEQTSRSNSRAIVRLLRCQRATC
jgi:hypothetical protein